MEHLAEKEGQTTADKMIDLGMLVVMPTYNNAKTLARTIDGILAVAPNLLVINDGSTDNTLDILKSYEGKIELISFDKNKGKGMALRAGFKYTLEHNYNYALTIDSDGQHYPEDIHLFVDKVITYPKSLIMGARGMKEGGAPSKSSFGNKFSNFWYYVETGIRLPDTQTGFRCYPAEGLKKIKSLSIFWNQRAVCLWDLSKNSQLTHIELDDFTRIHSLNDLATTTSLEIIKFGDKVWDSLVIDTLSMYREV